MSEQLCLARTPSDRRAAKFWDRCSLSLIAAVLLLVLLTFRDDGTTWDEDVHHWYGTLVLDYYLSEFRDRRALSWMNLYLYGAAFDTFAAALNRFSTLGSTRRAIF